MVMSLGELTLLTSSGGWMVMSFCTLLTVQMSK